MKKQVINRTGKKIELAKHTIEAGESVMLSSVLFSKEDLAKLKKDSKLGIYYIEDENVATTQNENSNEKDLENVSTVTLSKMNEKELRDFAKANNISIPKTVKKIDKLREIIENSLKGE
jgi:ribosomal protein L21